MRLLTTEVVGGVAVVCGGGLFNYLFNCLFNCLFNFCGGGFCVETVQFDVITMVGGGFVQADSHYPLEYKQILLVYRIALNPI